MPRGMLPRFSNDRTGSLWGFRCENCLWSYERQEQQSDFWQLLADARAMFEAHDCRQYQPARSRVTIVLPARAELLLAQHRCPDCLGNGGNAAGIPCSQCEGTGLVSIIGEDQIAS